MKELTESEIKQVELDVLKYIKSMCEKNNLTYYIAYGTLIGAIRHKGFIPWDDDIDIIMTRKDYFKLMKAMEQDKSSHYEFLSIHNVNDYVFPLAKVVDTRTKLVQTGSIGTHEKLGAYVDIFILDNIPDDKNERIAFYSKIKSNFKKWTLANRKPCLRKSKFIRDIVLAIASLPFKIKGARYYAEIMDKQADLYNSKSTKEQSVLLFTFSLSECEMETKEWNDKIEVPFEDDTFMTLRNYDKNLKNIYGDYMQFPPEDQRITQHSFMTYWKD